MFSQKLFQLKFKVFFPALRKYELYACEHSHYKLLVYSSVDIENYEDLVKRNEVMSLVSINFEVHEPVTSINSIWYISLTLKQNITGLIALFVCATQYGPDITGRARWALIIISILLLVECKNIHLILDLINNFAYRHLTVTTLLKKSDF